MLCQMRRFQTAAVSAAVPDLFRISLDDLFLRVVFYKADVAGFVIIVPRFPLEGNNIFFSLSWNKEASKPAEWG